jgi:hypothetical protein
MAKKLGYLLFPLTGILSSNQKFIISSCLSSCLLLTQCSFGEGHWPEDKNIIEVVNDTDNQITNLVINAGNWDLTVPDSSLSPDGFFVETLIFPDATVPGAKVNLSGAYTYSKFEIWPTIPSSRLNLWSDTTIYFENLIVPYDLEKDEYKILLGNIGAVIE